MADGKITVDELRSIGRGFLRGLGGFGLGNGHPFGRGFGPWGPKTAPSPSATPSPATSG
jgi:hypothetical protein